MKLISTLFLFFVIVQVQSQTAFSGIVSDASGQPIPGANVYLRGTYDGASTDTTGRFSFTTSASGDQELVVSYLGYETAATAVNASTGGLGLHIELHEAVNKLNAVVISAGSFTAGEASKREVLKPLDIVTTAGATADIAGVLNTLPGTQVVGETGRLFVRGGEGSETQTFIDGNLVAHPYSSSAPNTPGRGRFSPFMFGGISFSTGGYSAEYGQALSSALILNTKEVASQTRTDLSVMSVGGGITHTQKLQNGAVVAGVNYANLDPYMSLISQNIDWIKAPESVETDVLFQKKLENNDEIKFYSNLNSSSFKFNQQTHEEGALALKNTYYYGNGNYKKLFSDKWSLSSGISYTLFDETVALDGNDFTEEDHTVHVKSVAAHEVSDRVFLRMGAEYFYKDYTYDLDDIPPGKIGFERHLSAAFAEADLYASNNLVARAGVRGEYNPLQGKFYLAPRISVALKCGPHSQVSVASGLFNQSGEDELVRVRQDLEDQKAIHYIVNFQRSSDGRTFRVEGYYKQYKDLITYPGGSFNPAGYQNSGYGYARGIDVFWRDAKSISGLDYWLSYSYLDTERKYRDFPTTAVPVFASAHNFSAVGKYFVQQLKTQFGATWSFASPRPYNDPNSENFNAGRTKAYNDLSINLSYLPGPSIIIHASVTNVLGFENIYGYEVAGPANEAGIYPLRPIKPVAPRFIFLGIFITLSKDKTANQLPNL